MSSEFTGIVLTAVVVLLILYIIISDEWRSKRKRATRDGVIERQGREHRAPAFDENGLNEQGQYNRLYDVKAFRHSTYSAEGFRDPRKYPVFMSDHSRMRMRERLGMETYEEMCNITMAAYQYGKSINQVNESSLELMERAQERYRNSVLLLYQDIVFVFSSNNQLATIYKETSK